jgi:hypothetical protein
MPIAAATFEVTLTRRRTSPLGTFGIIGDAMAASVFHTLEPPIVTADGRRNVPDVTAILPGRYGLALKWSDHFHRLVVALLDVPGRSDIECHVGNYLKDTHGCILFGEGETTDGIVNSTPAVEDFTRMIADQLIDGRPAFLTVVDPPAAAAPVTS